MINKVIMAGLTAGALALGMGAAAAPANAGIYIGLGGFGGGYYPHHHGFYGGGWHHNHCGWVKVKKKINGHWRWRKVWRCW
ncbi:hypothetical protein [Aestuariivirga litoralis]|uniref:hypothetical protein n=1 Tax=Aestuariivirga litoralis TaxID=2650924 RepID=UPI0018C75CB0|nr:hypothetical protein [Aestuariivirga litoralis]MBG1232131.1 hypothetical protein [Aestuariivirga litoralis]